MQDNPEKRDRGLRKKVTEAKKEEKIFGWSAVEQEEENVSNSRILM